MFQWIPADAAALTPDNAPLSLPPRHAAVHLGSILYSAFQHVKGESKGSD